MVDLLPGELVVAQLLLPGEQPERRRRHGGEPGARLEAERAVAAKRAFRQDDVGLEAHGAAVAAATIGLLHDLRSCSGCGFQGELWRWGSERDPHRPPADGAPAALEH